MDKIIQAFLLDENNKSRVIDNGVVTSVILPTRIPQMFDGWQDILIAWERSLNHAQIRNFSLPMAFFMDSARLLRNDFYKFPIDRRLFLLLKFFVSEIDPVNFKDYYKFLHKLELDLTTGEDGQDEGRFTISGKEGGLYNAVKANEGTVYTIPFDNDKISVYDDGIKFSALRNFIVSTDLITSYGAAQMSVPIVSQAGEIDGVSVIGQDQSFSDGTRGMLLWDEPKTGRLKGTISLLLSGITAGTDIHFVLNRIDSGGVSHIISEILVPYINDSTLITVTYDQDITLTTEEQLLISMIAVSPVPVDRVFRFQKTKLTFTFDFQQTQSYVDAFLAYDLGRKLVEKMTGDANNFQSNLLSTSGIAFTCGNALRGFTGQAIKTSWLDFTKAINVYECTGSGAQGNKVLIERRQEFYDITDPVPLGTVSGLKVKFDKSETATSIKIGHQQQQIEDVGGKYDYNGYVIYTTPIKQGEPVEMDLQSPYKAGPVEIEKLRLFYLGQNTTDAPGDDEIFALVLNRASGVSNIPVTGGGFFVGTDTPIIYFIVLDYSPAFYAGQKIQITGSALNEGQYNIVSVGLLFSKTILFVDGPLVDENGPVDFNIGILGGTVYQLDRSTIIQSGVPNPETYFNATLRPAILIQKHLAFLKSWLFNYDDKELIFETCIGNADVVVGGVPDKRNLPISGFGERITVPYTIEFTPDILLSLQLLFADRPNASFTINNWKGNDYSGFFMSGGIGVANKRAQIMKLKLFGNTDVTKLIY